MSKAGETFIYRTPASDRLNRTLVRTATHGDGNCFLHALLTAIDPKYRKQSSHYAHLKIVREFRRQLADWVTLEVFQKLGHGEQLRLHFLSAFNEVLDDAYQQPSSGPFEDVLRSIVTRAQIDEDILPPLMTPGNTNFYVSFCEAIDHRLVQALRSCDSTKVRAMRQWVQSFFVGLFEQAHAQSLKDFRARLERLGEFVDSLQMECIARYTGYNFLFIREREQNAYPGLSHVVTFDPKRQCLVFLWVDENHFEIVGELERKTIINRIFEPEDELIHALLSEDESNAGGDSNGEKKSLAFATCA